MTPTLPGPESLGPLLARLRRARGRSQQALAAELCAASGVPTLSRHEVSRWERQLRVPEASGWAGWPWSWPRRWSCWPTPPGTPGTRAGRCRPPWDAHRPAA